MKTNDARDLKSSFPVGSSQSRITYRHETDTILLKENLWASASQAYSRRELKNSQRNVIVDTWKNV